MRTLFEPVTIYTQPGCQPCVRVRELLEKEGIGYDLVNLQTNDEARTYVMDVLKASTVPVIVTDVMDPIIGADPEKLKELIGYFTASETGL